MMHVVKSQVGKQDPECGGHHVLPSQIPILPRVFTSMEINSQSSRGLKAILQPKVLITVGFSLAFYLLIRAFEGVKFPDFPTQNLLPQTALLLTSLSSIAAMWWWQGRKWSYYFLAHLFSFGFGAAMLLAWSSYDYGAGGVSHDAWFSTAILVKYRYQAGNTDFAFKGLHSFYPSLYQYIGGRLADWTHTPGIKAMKYAVYWTAFLLPLVSYGLWRKVLAELPAFLMIIVAMAICRIHLAFKPFEVISMNVFIPWALFYVAGLRMKMEDGNIAWEIAPMLDRRNILIGGLIGGLCFMTFYYYFFLFIVWIPIQWMVEWRISKDVGAMWRRWSGFGAMIVVMMLVSAVYWVPLLGDFAKFGMISYQNRWFQHHMFGLPFDVSNQWKGLLGLIALIGLAPWNKLAQTILGIFVAVIAYILVGHWAMYAGFPLLHFRMVGLEEYLLQLGLILGAIRLMHHFKGFLDSKWEKILPVAVMSVFVVGMAMGFSWEKGNDDSQAAANAKLPELLRYPEFKELSKGKVFLTNRFEMVAHWPMYLFICHNAHYAHPAARFRERIKFLTLLCKSDDPEFISWMLQYNKYNAVDYVVLDGNRLTISDDNFPERQAHIGVDVQFEPHIFNSEFFPEDSIFEEVRHLKPLPADHWKTFTPAQQQLVALFSDQDKEQVRSHIPAATMTAMEDEIRIRVTDYPMWQRVFWHRYLREF
jgi:galactan 5-O-arabinofuranosyltransferase